MDETVNGGEEQLSPMFFSSPDLIKALNVAIEKIDPTHHSNPDQRLPYLKKFTHRCLTYFLQSPTISDQHCVYCIEFSGTSFKEALQAFNAEPATESEKLESLAALCYLFVTELEITLSEGLPSILEGWPNAIEESFFLDSRNRDIYRYARQGMMVRILRKYLHRKELVTLSQLPELIRKGELFKKNLEESLNNKKKDVEKLKNSLDDYEKSFNFLGLNRAFRSMRALKIKEARNTLRFLIVLGISMIAPLLIKFSIEIKHNFSTPDSSEEIGYVLSSSLEPSVGPNAAVASSTVNLQEKNSDVHPKSKADEDKGSNYFKQIVALMAFLGYELVFLYFFKVVLHNYRSVKSQLLQIDLRVALTQFILKYSEYAGSANPTTAGTFERFEQVIFSSIMGGDSDIPSTFDGLDQVVKVLEKVRPS